MRIRCTRLALTEEQQESVRASSRFRPNHRLTIGKEYLVLGIVCIIGSPQYGNTALFELQNDHSQLVLYPAMLFEVTDSRCSSYWRAATKDDGSLLLRPEELHKEFFHDDLSEGDPATQEMFRAMVYKMETEFPK